jgi:hypothetical protein
MCILLGSRLGPGVDAWLGGPLWLGAKAGPVVGLPHLSMLASSCLGTRSKNNTQKSVIPGHALVGGWSPMECFVHPGHVDLWSTAPCLV